MLGIYRGGRIWFFARAASPFSWTAIFGMDGASRSWRNKLSEKWEMKIAANGAAIP